jgi:hypothetical protein
MEFLCRILGFLEGIHIQPHSLFLIIFFGSNYFSLATAARCLVTFGSQPLTNRLKTHCRRSLLQRRYFRRPLIHDNIFMSAPVSKAHNTC